MTKGFRKPSPTEGTIKTPTPPAKSLKEKLVKHALEKAKKYDKKK